MNRVGALLIEYWLLHNIYSVGRFTVVDFQEHKIFCMVVGHNVITAAL
eukprot:SAG11_NODE_3014_length_2762_cov_1.890349_3_plen_48_part_00